MMTEKIFRNSRCVYRENEYSDLQTRIDEMKFAVNVISQGRELQEKNDARSLVGSVGLSPKVEELLLDLGYEKRTVANKNYKDAHANVYVRDDGNTLDVLVEDSTVRFENTSVSLWAPSFKGVLGRLSYLKISKKKLRKVLRYTAKICVGNKITVRNRFKRSVPYIVGYSLAATFVFGGGYLLGLMKMGVAVGGAIGNVIGQTGFKVIKSSKIGGDSSLTKYFRRKSEEKLLRLGMVKGGAALINALYLHNAS